MKDAEIIESIKRGGTEKESIAKFLFEEYKGFIPKVKQKLGLTQLEIQDVYTDAIIKLLRQLSGGKFQEKSKLSSYFYSIFYNTGVDAMRKKSTNRIEEVQLHEFDMQEQSLMDLMESKEKVKHVMLVMDQLGKSCKKILIDWGYHGFSMEEIADRSSLRNPESARSMKYKCLKKLRDLLADKLFIQ